MGRRLDQNGALDRTIERFRTLAATRFAGCQTVVETEGRRSRPGIDKSIELIRRVCKIAGCLSIIDDARVELARVGVLEAVQRHDDKRLFNWLNDTFSYQGVSDAAAFSFMESHGRVTAGDIAQGLVAPACDKLTSYWHFAECGYRKLAKTCAHPELLLSCSLPRHDLRNGRLNQTAYSLWLFLRDVTRGDFVGWVDRRLELAAARRVGSGQATQMAAAVLDPMRHIYGVSDKVLSMSLSMLLLAGDQEREQWRTAGAAMIAIDTLVHNWMHRTGILGRFGFTHAYGSVCNSDHGCSSIIAEAARRIDARTFNPVFPRTFPRFVQHAIWRFCAQSGVNRCNGNRIDDGKRCADRACQLYGQCGRIALNTGRAA